MPTAYTSLLGLALPATGELAGTWGDTFNTAITSLLDAAIAGTTTLSTDADVTLTTTTGAANQARQQILLCTGSRAAQRTVIAPAQSKTYTVINATTGGFGVRVAGVGPTTGVVVAAGERAFISWNGSDFVKVGNSFGAGVATRIPFFDGTGALTSAAEFVRDASGNVGIGQTPAFSSGGGISLYTLTDTRITLRNSTTGAGALAGGGVAYSGLDLRLENREAGNVVFTTLNLERLRIDASGNVGIGRTPTVKLDVQGEAVQLLSGAAGGFAYYDLGTNAARARWGVAGGANQFITGTALNDSVLYTIGSNSLIFGTNQAERLRIDASGNVGIGFSASLPAASTGGSASAGLFTARSQLLAHQTSMGVLQFTSVGNLTQIRSYGATPGTGAIAFQVGGGGGSADFEAVRIDASGNVGIGTASPAYRLDVNGVANFAANLIHRVGAVPMFGGTGGTLNYLYTGTTALAVRNAADTAELFRIDNSGHQINTPANTTPPTLTVNGQWTLTPTSNTNFRISYRGTDGVTRVANITLA